jgi:hypothetical protein
LSASEQGQYKVRQVVCDDVVVCNAADHIDWSAYPVQFLICADCLYVGCADGGRVAIRRADECVLIIPDFTAMFESDWAAMEYRPPHWMAQRGALSFSRSTWKLFQAACVKAPSFDSITPASTSELLRLYHFQAPRQFLGDYLSPSLAQWELILCTSGRDSGDDVQHLKKLFSDPSTFDGHEFCTPLSDSYTVSVFLDLPSIPEWPIFSSESDPAVRLSDDIYFRPIPRI